MRPRYGLTSLLRTAITLLAICCPAHADDWVGGSGQQIGALDLLATYEGGALRVFLANPMNVPYCWSSSGQAPLLQILFTNGTQETRSSLVAGLYVAFTEGKAVTFLLSSAACSPDGSPVIVGLHMTS
jgi:hypothetical protein